MILNHLKKARDENRIDDKKLKKELAKKRLNLYYSRDTELQIGFNPTLDSHHFNHTNSKLTFKPNFKDIGIERRYINKIINEMATNYASLIDQYKFKKQTV